jgi:drug/metabolite transporter (DMT)-like permease
VTSTAARPGLGYALAALAAFFWATGGLTAKWLFTRAGLTIDPVTLSAARAMTATALLWAALLLFDRRSLRVARRDLWFLAAFGVLGLALVHFTYFKTISLTNVATAILLEYLAPVLVLIVSVAFMGERFRWTLPAGVALAVSGSALVVGAASPGGLAVSPAGIAWGLASAVFFAGYSLMGRWAAPRFSAWTLLAWGLLFASVFWLVLQGGPARVFAVMSTPVGAGAIAFVAVFSTIVPFGAYLIALRHIDATKATITATLEPVIAGAAAWVLLGESLDALQIAGMVGVIAAVWLVQRPDPAAATEPELPPAL